MSNTQTTSKIAEDYFHLYLGCEVIFGFPERRKKGQLIGKVEPFGWQVFDYSNAIVPNHNVRPDLIMPILRPLSDMTEEEKKLLKWEHSSPRLLAWFKEDNVGMTAKEFIYLLKQGFDLFGLIEEGLALDRTKL
jgi:hypothetical protein